MLDSGFVFGRGRSARRGRRSVVSITRKLSIALLVWGAEVDKVSAISEFEIGVEGNIEHGAKMDCVCGPEFVYFANIGKGNAVSQRNACERVLGLDLHNNFNMSYRRHLVSYLVNKHLPGCPTGSFLLPLVLWFLFDPAIREPPDPAFSIFGRQHPPQTRPRVRRIVPIGL